MAAGCRQLWRFQLAGVIERSGIEKARRDAGFHLWIPPKLFDYNDDLLWTAFGCLDLPDRDTLNIY
jgi:hypothetical protein